MTIAASSNLLTGDRKIKEYYIDMPFQASHMSIGYKFSYSLEQSKLISRLNQSI